MSKYRITKDVNAPKGAAFPNKRHIVLPQQVVKNASSMVVTRNLFLTKTGHFPVATGHFVERKTPIDEWILIYCTDGKGWCVINDEEFNMRADTAILIPKGVPHAYAADEHSPWTIYWVHIIGNQMSEYAQALNITVNEPVMHLKHGGELIHHFDEFYSVLKYGYTPAALVALSTSLAHFLGELNLQRCRPGQKDFAIEDNLYATIEFMHLNIFNSLTLKELAQFARLSISHYTTTFNELTGLTPMKFFIDLKMKKAAELLHDPERKIKDVAAMIGFDDPYYFSRCFKKSTGYSPANYRKLDFLELLVEVKGIFVNPVDAKVRSMPQLGRRKARQKSSDMIGGVGSILIQLAKKLTGLTVTRNLGKISAETMKEAHIQQESGRVIGKNVLYGFNS